MDSVAPNLALGKDERCWESPLPSKPGKLVIVEPAAGWAPASWRDRPTTYTVVEEIRESSDGDREYCMGFNHQAVRTGDFEQWAMVIATGGVN